METSFADIDIGDFILSDLLLNTMNRVQLAGGKDAGAKAYQSLNLYSQS